MPYITAIAREALDTYKLPRTTTAGELNYLFTKLSLNYLEELRTLYPHLENNTYQHYNDVIGALEGAKLEFYRRVVVPYEDKKIEQNGDVY
jgi:hypothetical protein